MPTLCLAAFFYFNLQLRIINTLQDLLGEPAEKMARTSSFSFLDEYVSPAEEDGE